MADTAPRPNGIRAWRPAFPLGLVVVAVAVALVSVSGLLYLLYTRTTGPGQVLRDFVQRVDSSDCRGSYGLLDPTLRIESDRWCDGLEALAGEVDEGFSIRRVVLEGDIALVRVTNPDGTVQAWELIRDGRSWLVHGARRGVANPLLSTA